MMRWKRKCKGEEVQALEFNPYIPCVAINASINFCAWMDNDGSGVGSLLVRLPFFFIAGEGIIRISWML